MQVAPNAAIIAAMLVVPTVPVARDPESPARQHPKNWVAPRTIGRGTLIDLIV